MSPAEGPARPALSTALQRVRGWAAAAWRAVSPMQVWSLWAVLAAGLALGLVTTQPPSPAPATAPSDSFSARRAFKDVEVIGGWTHPTGSPQAEEVRRYIFDRLSSMGLTAEVRVAEAVEASRRDPSHAAGGALQNIVATLPGDDSSLPALLVMAHSDSVPNSPGAADDGAGVAVLLETARSLAADRPHKRDVIFAVTDGEEIGLLGARAFFAKDPLAPHVGAVINMDTRGDGGRATMFQLGPRSGGLLGVYRRAAPRPYANSLTALLFKILPNDTDFSISIAKGVPGLNFAFIGDQLAYHTPLATPGHLSKASLQTMGAQVLPVARALADAETLPQGEPPAAYSDLFGLTLIGLPVWALALLWLVTVGLGGFAAWRGWKDRLFHRGEAVRGTGLALICVLAAALTLTAAGTLLGGDYLREYALVGRYAWLFAGCALLALATTLGTLAAGGPGRWRRQVVGGVILAGLATQAAGWSVPPLVLTLVAAGLAWIVLGKGVGSWGLWIGAMALGLALSLLAAVAAPGAAPLVLFPTLLGAASAAAVFGAGARERWAKAALILTGLLAVVSAGWLCGWASGLFVAAGPSLPALLCPFALLLLVGVAPFARWWTGQSWAPWVIAALAAASVVILAFVGFARPTAARPQPTAAYVVKERGRPALFVAPARALDPWTRQVLAQPNRTTLEPVFARPVWTGPAPAAVSAPEPRVEAVRVDDRLILHLYPDGSGRRLTLWLRSAADLADPRLDARALDWKLTPNRWSRLDLHAPPPEGFTLSLHAPPGVSAEVVLGQLNDGWPRGATPPPMPRGYMPFADSGSTLGVTRTTVRP